MKSFLKHWWIGISVGVVILVIGIFLRAYDLTSLPIFADEAIYIRWAQVMRNEPTLRFLPLSDGKQPLFMWLVIPFFKVISDPLIAGRMASVFSGIFSLVGIFVLSYLMFKSKVASLFSSFFYAISSYAVFFDRMALVDSLLSMFGIWCFIFSFLAFSKKRLDFSMIAGFLLGGALLTKSPSIFYSLLIPTLWIFSKWGKSKKDYLKNLFKLIFLTVPTYLIGYGMYNILRLGPNFNMVGSRNQDYIFPLNHLWTNPKDPFIFFIDRSFEWIWSMGPWPILFLAGLGIIVCFRKYWREIAVIFIWFMLPIMVQSEFARVFTARYILFALPYLYVLAGLAFMVKNKLLKYLVYILAGISVFISGRFYYLLQSDIEKAPIPRSERSGYLEEWTSGIGIREVAKYLNNELKVKTAGGNIIVGTEGYFGTLPDGLQIYFNGVSGITVIGVGVVIDKIPDQLENSLKAGNDTYLVVNSSRFKIENPALSGLKLIASYPKAERPEEIKEYYQYGPRDSLLFFKLEKIQ